MSGIFEGDQAEPARPARRTPSQRPRALLPTLAVVVLLFVLGSVFVEVWTDKLWFSSLGFGSVFTKVLWTRVGLFVVFGLLLAGVAMGNAYLAFRMRPILIGDSYRNPTVERYQDTIDPIRHWILIGLGLVFFLFGGASAAGQWKPYLMWRHGGDFGQEDVFFGIDIGFFVFDYSWYRFLVSFGFSMLVIGVIVAAVTHYVYGGIRLQAKRDKIASGAQIQLSVLLGMFMLVRAVSYWLDRYGLAIADGGLLTGVTYTDANAVLPSKNILAVIAIICALLFFGNVVRPGWMLPVLGFGLLILSAILIGGIWPAIVQRFTVQPTEADKEAIYIEKNINATRLAFDLDDVDIRAYPGVSTNTAEELQAAASSLPSIRIIDPRLVSDAFEQLQQQRGFYSMPDVLDVDRYAVEGEADPQDVVIAVRELNLAGLRPDQRNWTNEHTVYTHGYGVVAAYGDRRSPTGEPVWAQQNLPSVGLFDDFEQRIYFGESEPAYSIVGAPEGAAPVELNIPETSTAEGLVLNTTYDGEGGVPIGSTFRQLLFAGKFWDSSILLSGRVNSESRVIYDREPREMVEKVAPWLTVDGDPYPAVVDGRVLWIMDGYTSTASYPMSDLVDLSEVTSDSLTAEQAVAGQQSDDINYIRNSVKATVDAYDGTVTLYAWDEEDPLLQAWMRAFPGVVTPQAEISEGLLAHLRYPEDLFKVQRELLSRYHVTEPQKFYGGSENWKVPEDPTEPTSSNVAQPPFYLTVQLPDGAAEFSLTSVYVPQGRENLASFMSVNADATSEEYGQFSVLELPSDTALSGPRQAANVLSNDGQVTQKLLRFSRQDVDVERGNLLTLPIGDELLYAQPVYTTRGGTGSYKILQYVVVSISGDVGIGRSFEEALASALMLGGDTTPTEEPPPGTGGPGEPPTEPPPANESDEEELTRILAKADAAFEEAQQALEDGDLQRYQEANERGWEWIDEAVILREEMLSQPPDGETAPPDGGEPTGDGEPTDGEPTDGEPTDGADGSPDSTPTESSPTGS